MKIGCEVVFVWQNPPQTLCKNLLYTLYMYINFLFFFILLIFLLSHILIACQI